MIYYQPNSKLNTHEVFNQSKELCDYNLFDADVILKHYISEFGANEYFKELSSFGEIIGSKENIERGRLANSNPPILHQFDRFGHRVDEVEYHPAYHELMTIAKEHRVDTIAWTAKKKASQLAHVALEYMLFQVESGICCPLTMTYAALPAIKNHPALYEELLPKLTSNKYLASLKPISEKESIMVGMAMTEKQGGSDIRANTSRAELIDGNNGEYLLTGHKWFCSAPMSDAFLTLAQSKSGISCFFVPRILPDGQKNRFFIQRLKDKLGNKSNASSEIEYDKTWAMLIGEEGRGVRTIIDMVHHTRLDCTLAAASLMRQSLSQAIFHSDRRKAFGKKLSEQALMKNVLADMALESEAALAISARIGKAYDDATINKEQAPLARILVAIGKYWTNKRTAYLVNEAMECFGGGGYVEESIMPRLYRESPLNGIWEGSGNVICLDVLRAFMKEPETVNQLFHELESSKGNVKAFDTELEKIKKIMSKPLELETRARYLVEKLAILLQSKILIENSKDFIAEAFVNSRLKQDWGYAFGTLNAGIAFDKIIERSRLRLS